MFVGLRIQRTTDNGQLIGAKVAIGWAASALLSEERWWAVPTLLFQDHVDAEDGGKDELPDLAVGWDVFGDREHVVVGGREHLLADAGPFLGDAGELVVGGDEAEVPAGPFALEVEERLVVRVEHLEGAADREEFLFEAANARAVFVPIEDVDFRDQKRDAAADVNDRLAGGRANVDRKWRETFVVGEAEHLRKEAKAVLAALKDLFVGFGVVDVVVVGRFEESQVFFDEEQIAVENGVHTELVSAMGSTWFESPQYDRLRYGVQAFSNGSWGLALLEPSHPAPTRRLRFGLAESCSRQTMPR